MTAVAFRPQAERDLDDIWLYIARDDPGAADALVDHFTRVFQTLAASPLIGPACPDLGPGLRRQPTRGYVIFYTPGGTIALS